MGGLGGRGEGEGGGEGSCCLLVTTLIFSAASAAAAAATRLSGVTATCPSAATAPYLTALLRAPRYPPLMLKLEASGKLKPRQLRQLAAEQLGLSIQGGEHSPVDDARAALYLYQKHKKVGEGGGSRGGPGEGL